VRGASQHAHDQPVVVEPGEVRGCRPGGIEFGVGGAGLGRRADNAGADEGAAGHGDHRGDAFNRLRAQRVAVDIDGFLVGGAEHAGQALRQCERVARRHDRKQEIALRQLRVGHRGHAGRFCAGRARLAAAGKRGEDVYLALGQAAADRGAHIARRDDGNG
jgi:hypothetical protein